MIRENNMPQLLQPIQRLAAYVAPAMFIIGYVIGTGSVTSMSVAGARFGLSLLWALLLSCLFSFVLLTAVSRLTMVTGQTILYNIRTHVHWSLALLLLLGLGVSVVSSVVGVMGIVVEALQEWSRPWSDDPQGWSQFWMAFWLAALLYGLFLTGRQQSFLKVVSLLVALMGIAFLMTNFLVIDDSAVLLQGLVPRIPEEGNAPLVISGMVGTTMAAVVLVSRSILVQENHWTIRELNRERKDAALSMFLTFIISASIMVSAAGTLYAQGIPVDNAIEMVNMLEPIAGRLAVSLFVIGILCAGLSSIFPNLLLIPWLITDYRHTSRDVHRPVFRVVVLLVALSTLAIPVFGGKPVFLLILSQALSPLMMPLLVGLLIVLLNKKKLMGEHAVGFGINLVLGVTLVFTLFTFVVAWQGMVELLDTG